MTPSRKRLLVRLIFALALPASSRAQDAARRPAEVVQDNSFFIEEAYNQEAGVVQHIMNVLYTVNRQGGSDERDLSFIFTQEWPAPNQTHQLSYTVPYTFLEDGGDRANGFEDVSLNYRFQALMESETHPAFAPRFTLILPTGEARDGLGNDAVGYQTNLPVSKIVTDRMTLHGNAGATFFPGARGGNDLYNYNLGGSVIYAVTPRFNLLLEAVANWEEEVNDTRRKEHTFSAFISPGFRFAFNHPNKAQTVVGLAVPVGLSGDAPDIGVFIYASFEHFFLHPKSESAK